MKKIKLFLAMLISVMMLVSCGGSKVVGKWENTTTHATWEFFKDGKFTVEDDVDGEYSVDGNRIRFDHPYDGSFTADFEINGNTMILRDDNGNVLAEFRKEN